MGGDWSTVMETNVCGQMSADVWRRQVSWLLVRRGLQEVGNNNIINPV